MHCLNLKLTYECTNHCSFCFSSYLKGDKISLDSLKYAVKQGYENGCDELVLSGGEPTLYAEWIIELLTIAENLGYKKYIIQTNGVGLSDTSSPLLPFLNALSLKKEVCISFSVHGHCAKIHDEMSSNPGAFHKLMDAICHVSQTNCQIYTNTVISALNLKSLKEIVKLIMPYHPTIMQFSMMHLSSYHMLSVSLSEAVKEIRRLKGHVDLCILKTEGIPYCLMYGMEKCVGESCWPAILDIYNKEQHYMSDFRQLDSGMRKKLDSCSSCIMNEICVGVWTEHFEELMKIGVIPIN